VTLHALIKKYWFLIGLVLVFTVTLVDTTKTVSSIGTWLKEHRGPNAVIFFIFFFSGVVLETSQIKAGLKDIQGTLIALGIIYLVAPLMGALFGTTPLDVGVKIGIFLVAAMPTTLSSGVVMTGSAGGNMAHALVITILANGLAAFTIPITLSLLLYLVGGTTDVTIDKSTIMVKILVFVLLPLGLGLLSRFYFKAFADRLSPKLQILNQCFILGMVWMAVSQARPTIISSGELIGIILVLTFVFHGVLLVAAGFFVRLLKVGRGRRESVIFMGGQKTLPLSVLLQVSLFPQYGAALVVCVIHHIVHLMMDGYLVGRLKEGGVRR
jgi:sodium/bile acid cotransporter 7